MSEKADFYVLPSGAIDDRGRFLCRFVEKISALGHQIYIQVPDRAEAERIDQLLWEFRPESFLPHGILGEGPSASIQIGYQQEVADHQDVYINLSLHIPESALAFKRIIEIVVQNDQVLDATRSNYKRYKESGVSIDMHDMRKV